MNRTTTHSDRRLGSRHKRIGVVFVHERGLDLEIWNGRPCPSWSLGVIGADEPAPAAPEALDVPGASSWLLVLPTYLCVTRYTWLPSSRADEIAEMLEFELPRIAPCSTQPWTWDYSVVQVQEDRGSQVLVVLSPASVVASALERARALGIEPRLVTVGAALHAARLARDKSPRPPDRHGYVWWDGDSMDFLVTEGTRAVFLRGARIGENAAPPLDLVEAEVGRSLSMFRQLPLGPTELPLCVQGTSPELPRLVERLGRMEDVRIDETTLQEAPAGPAAADAIASSLRGAGSARTACADLLPRPLKEKRRRRRWRRQIFMHGLRICLVVLLALLCLRVSAWRTTRSLHRYEQRLAEISPLAQKLQFLQAQLDVIQAQVQGNVSTLDIIGELYQVLPPDVSIHYLSIDDNRRVVVRAQAKRLSQAFDCIDPLERSGYLADVRQNYAHLREIEGQVLIDFELAAHLERPTVREAGP